MIWIAIAGCTLAASFFAGLETGLVSANQFSLYAKKEKGILYARAADFLLLKPERLLSTTLIGTNISVVTSATLLANFLRQSGPEWSRWVGSIGLAVAMLIFSEVVPKSFFRQNADTVAVRLAPVLVVFFVLFSPLALILNTIVKGILWITGQLESSNEAVSSRQSLRTLVRLSSREAGIPLEDQRIVEDIFDFQDTLAREVMIQIHRTLSCPRSMDHKEIVMRATEWNVRFVPIYDQRIDNVLGFIDIAELAVSPSLELDEIIHPPRFFPDTKPIPDLLLAMNSEKLRVVFLSNEYGRISGIITPTEIVGEIMERRPGGTGHRLEIRPLEEGGYSILGLADVEDVRHVAGVMIPDGPYDTLGGYLLTRFGRIPEVNESIADDNVTYVVEDRDDLHIKRVRVTPTTAPA